MPERRQTYLSFQGLLTAVLLLFFLYQRREIAAWALKLVILTLPLFGLLAMVRFCSAACLSKTAFQSALLLADAFLASLTLYWTQDIQSEMYVAYFMIILGAALTRKLSQCFLIAVAASVFYTFSAYTPGLGFPQDPGFWMRIPFLWIMAFLSAVLSQDAQQAKKETEQAYQEQLLQMERLAALGQLAAEVAHRIKGPLTSILVTADVLGARKGARGMAGDLSEIRTEVQHCQEILRSLLNLGRIEETVFQPLDLCEPLRSAVEALRSRLEAQKIRLRLKGLERRAQIIGDRSLLHEAFYAVLQNAVDAMPEGGVLDACLAPIDKRAWWSEPGNALEFYEISISDTGSGFDEKTRNKLFQPFFTTKNG